MDEILYQLYVIDKIRQGQAAVDQGQFIASDELKREIETW